MGKFLCTQWHRQSEVFFHPERESGKRWLWVPTCIPLQRSFLRKCIPPVLSSTLRQLLLCTPVHAARLLAWLTITGVYTLSERSHVQIWHTGGLLSADVRLGQSKSQRRNMASVLESRICLQILSVPPLWSPEVSYCDFTAHWLSFLFLNLKRA